ncbi:MAG: hypothetical protein WCJ30_01425 [Deltaproteobacteria bacterium]
MNVLRAAILSACAASTGAACAGSQAGHGRDPEAALVDVTAAETLRTMSAVQWEPVYNQGVLLANSGDLTRAEQYLAAALQRGAPPERVLPRLLRVCVAAQRYRAAIEYARPFLERRPDAWPLQYLVATIHMGLGEPQSARLRLEMVIQHHPSSADAEFALGKIYRDDLGDRAVADGHFRRYLELEPDGAHAQEARDGLLSQVRP